MEEYIYEPSEDSYFMLNCLEKLLEKKKLKKALEIGTGSGVIAFKIADKVEKVLATDINPYAIKIAEKKRKILGIKNIEFKESNLFEKVNEKFDLIFFNPPYLPGKEDVVWSGGEKGQEGNARAEVNRFIHSPTQPMSYLIGYLDLMKLREDYKKMKGDGFNLKEFHDELLSYGSVPIILLRGVMLGERDKVDTVLAGSGSSAGIYTPAGRDWPRSAISLRRSSERSHLNLPRDNSAASSGISSALINYRGGSTVPRARAVSLCLRGICPSGFAFLALDLHAISSSAVCPARHVSGAGFYSVTMSHRHFSS